MKAVLFSCKSPSLRWKSKERLVWRVRNNKVMVRRWRDLDGPNHLCDHRQVPWIPESWGNFLFIWRAWPVLVPRATLGESSKGDVKKLGCCFTCQYRRASQFTNTQKVQCRLNAGNLMSDQPLAHPVLRELKAVLLLIKSRVTLTRKGIKLLSPLHIIKRLFM